MEGPSASKKLFQLLKPQCLFTITECSPEHNLQSLPLVACEEFWCLKVRPLSLYERWLCAGFGPDSMDSLDLHCVIPVRASSTNMHFCECV